MNAAVERLARALIYEGYVLYPYRASSLKNRRRWAFGALFPAAWSEEPAANRTECLARAPGDATVEVHVRFLQLVDVGGWQQAVERRVDVPAARFDELVRGVEHSFRFDGAPAGTDTEARGEPVEGRLRLEARAVGPGGGGELWALTAELRNTSPWTGADRDEAALRALASAHTFYALGGGEWISLVDPPAEARAAAAACRSLHTWPILVGDRTRRDLLLSSPILVDEFPRLAPESPGDLFDGGEIDEILTLRVLTLTDDEKRQARAGDPIARELLDRTEALGEEAIRRLHGTLRDSPRRFVPGDRVRLSPRAGADIFDLALRGRAATVTSVQEDVDDRVWLSVVLDDDPGRDLGIAGLPGHRFFFGVDEVEPLS